jgi:crotonobetainyl-CoA:carnitine CoA-transferase CaiB-like acyl-CoA transferase
MTEAKGLLSGVRVIESALLGPGAITTHLADLGADVIKIEPPNGDYIRQMTWPIIVEGSGTGTMPADPEQRKSNSLLHLHIHRGKRSVALDLRKPEAVEVYKELVRGADAVIEAMRPGALAKRGLGYEDLKQVNPRIVFCTISGYGMTGPYKDMPSHGIAYDTWAGQVPPAYDDDGFCYIPEHSSIGIHAGPVFGSLGILAAIIRARETGEGCFMEVAQSDAAAYFDWYRIETWRAYERPEDEVTGNASDNYERRAPGTAGMKEGVRYQMYESADGHVLFMASEREFWKNFCEAMGRMDLFERWPGSQFADHARNNTEMHVELRKIFKTKTSAEWLEFGNRVNTPMAPVNTPKTIADDPQFQDRLPWIPASRLDVDQLPFPVKLIGEELPVPQCAPTPGQHSDEVLGELLGYDSAKLTALREAGALA